MYSQYDPLKLYFKAISEIKPLSRQEMSDLWKKSKKNKKIFDKLVEQNYRLVVPIAKRFIKKGIDFMDLIEEGNMGLIKAVEKYDPKKNTAFSTYAVYWIEQYIRKAIENQTKTIRIPSHVWDSLNLWMKTWTTLRDRLGREPSVAEVSKKLKLNKKQTENILKSAAVFNGTSSLETPIDEEEEIFIKDIIIDEKVKSPESVTEIIRTNADIGTALNYLPVREMEVVRMRFGIGGLKPMSLEEIGKVLRVSRERVRQLELKAFKRLKGIFVRYGFVDKDEAARMMLDSRSRKKDRRHLEKKVSKVKDRRKKDRRV
ncbi:MAG: RNA polymerase sigma factor RpoD/SigA [Endomicrobia bacterium]|nr:RNA polymerase sigma factor RpoD/SigA [Endomicrobiia bacterium]MCL2507495.1 RNA polymerase sigma factor RpoD/SigA [Endomicrobiia bacterium]